jgi:hypothetical protein
VVPPLSGWLLLELGLGDGVNSSPGGRAPGDLVAAKSSHSAMQKRIGKARQNAPGLASKMTLSEVTTEACGVSGTTVINDDGLRTDGTGVVIFTFRDCAEGDGTTLNGVMRITIAAANALEPTDYTLSLENIRISIGNASIETGGTARIVVAGATVTTTRNTVARYMPDNVYVRLQDFVETESPFGQATGLTFRGRFYQSQYGYVDVQTPATVVIDPSGGLTLGGRMLMSSGAARVELRFRERNMLSVVVDSNGDGIAERGLSADARLLLEPVGNFLPMADAGPDLTVDEGVRVTLEADGNRDWEGAPVEFSWSLLSVPFNAPGLAESRNGYAFAFTPTVPGAYVVQLTVSDGSGSAASDRVIVLARNVPGAVANAGPDLTTLERSTVRLDATGTTHPTEPVSSLEFSWIRLDAPPNSTAPASLTGTTPEVAIDLPGTYRYRLVVSGRGGLATDIVTITAEPVLSSSIGGFIIVPNSTTASTTMQLPIRVHQNYTGAPLSLTISSDTDWLTIDTPNVTTATSNVIARLDLDELETLANGTYQAVVRIAPAGYAEWSGTVVLNLQLPSVQRVSPYVVYTGQQTTANLLGDQLHLAAGRLYVNNVQVTGLARESSSKARAELPALTAGEYTVTATNALGIERQSARLIVRDPPAHPDGEVTLPGRAYSLEYDPERDVFYGVFYTDGGTYVARRFHRQADATWQFDVISVPNPRALTLTLGGERLLVTSNNCTVYELDPVTLQTLTSAAKSYCYYEDMGLIAAMTDGQVLVANTNQWSSVWLYPGFNQQYQLLPSIHSPIGVVSHDRSRMLWAEGPSISGPRELYVLDMLGGAASSAPSWSGVGINDSSTYFLRSNLAISGDGLRFMHREDVYNEFYTYVGSLQGISGPGLTPALSRRGTRAAVYNDLTDELSLFDVSTGTSFPALNLIGTFGEEVTPLQLGYYPDDAAVFLLGMVRTGFSGGTNTYDYRLFVRQVP